MQSAPQELDYLESSTNYNHSPHPSERSSQQFGLLSTIPEKTTSHTRLRARWNSMSWKWQILGWLSSLGCFLAIILVLRAWDGRPLPDLRFGITPNALIGLLATFTELLLIAPVNSAFGQLKWLRALRKKPMDDFRTIDEASRGPWGSVLLLLRRTGGGIGSFGALVTIIALGTSTFSQQALKYDTIYPHSDVARIPIAQDMNGTGWAYTGGGLSQLGVDPEMLSAPYMAIFNKPTTNFTPSAYCGTGNCTWEPYQTLAFCNTCANVTAQLKMAKFKVNGDYTDHYTLPNGFGLTGNKYNDDSIPSAAVLNITTTSPIASGIITGGDYKSVAFAQNGSKLMSVFAVGPAPGTFPAQPDIKKTYNNMTGPQFAPPIAYECMLQLCVRTMRAEFRNGVLTETEVSTWTDQRQLPKNLNDVTTLKPPGSNKPFRIPAVAIAGTTSWLAYLLNGTSTITTNDGHWDITNLPYSTSEVVRSFHASMNRTTAGFPDLMDNLANSLSLNLRTIPYQPSPVLGKAFTSTSHAVVTWIWLILPAFELIASLIFLLTIMMQTRRKGLTAWTNNPLPYFFHGLDERPHREHIYKSQIEMEEKARKILVEFQKHEDGNHLIVVQG